jgi:hypothetical protein
MKARSFAALVIAVLSAAACTITPRASPPAKVFDVTSPLQQTTDCTVAQLNKAMSHETKARGEQEPIPPVTHAVRVVDQDKVVEVFPQYPTNIGELYFVRLSAQQNGTHVELFSTLGVTKLVEGALSSCVGGSKPGAPPKK